MRFMTKSQEQILEMFVVNLFKHCLSDKLGIRILISRISGSHGGEYEDGCILGCSPM
jgi:hypothetical protein